VASRTITILVDDFDGTELNDGEGQMITFAVGNAGYEIDLSDENLGKFYDVLKPYTDVARKVGSGRRGQSAAAGGGRAVTSGVDPRAVRVWAASNSIEVSARGRVPATIIEQFKEAGN